MCLATEEVFFLSWCCKLSQPVVCAQPTTGPYGIYVRKHRNQNGVNRWSFVRRISKVLYTRESWNAIVLLNAIVHKIMIFRLTFELTFWRLTREKERYRNVTRVDGRDKHRSSDRHFISRKEKRYLTVTQLSNLSRSSFYPYKCYTVFFVFI